MCPWHDPPEKEREEDEEPEPTEIGVGEKPPPEIPDAAEAQVPERIPKQIGVEAGDREPLGELASAVAKNEVEEPANVPPDVIAVTPSRVFDLREAHNETQGVPNDRTYITQGPGLHNESQGVRGTGRYVGKIGNPQLARELTPALVRNMAIRSSVTGATGDDLVQPVEEAVAEATTSRGKRQEGVSRATRQAQDFQLKEARAAVGNQATAKALKQLRGKAVIQAIRQAQNSRAVTPPKGKGGVLTKVVAKGVGQVGPSVKFVGARGGGGKIKKQPKIVQPGSRKVAPPPRGRIVETDSGPVWMTDDEMGTRKASNWNPAANDAAWRAKNPIE